MAAIKFTKKQAIERFSEQLKSIDEGATPIYEVRTFPIDTLLGAQKAIGSVEKGSAIWQHTTSWHTAMIYIEKGRGYRFNRDMLDLVASGIDDIEKFEELWDSVNEGLETAYFPKTTKKKTSSMRMGQASYIVSDFNKGEKEESKLGSLTKNNTHRTHLISVQVTGVERHKGLLIDYDGWLNMNAIKRFETEILKKSTVMDLIWTTNIWLDAAGLHWKYVIYDGNWMVVKEQEWTDDRWHYIWYYDKGQDLLKYR